jgi:hypothetical protein
MKTYFTLLALAVGSVAGPGLTAQTLNWGSQAFSDFADSSGNTLDHTFLFELGAFVAGFDVQTEPTSSWLENWRVFDRASYNQGNGVFTSSVQMLDDGTSNSPYLSPGGMSFAGLSAYLWVRKGDDPVEGSEWLLTRADNWTFPAPIPGCCDTDIVEWSVSDLNGGNVPEWGSQGGVDGPGVHSDTGPHTLQTYTFVPEPSTVILAPLAGFALMLRRRRGNH